MNIIWSPEALADLEAAVVERLASEELDGPEHVLGNGERVHGWPFPPFRIYYQRTPEAFFVVRVYHQRREPIVR